MALTDDYLIENIYPFLDYKDHELLQELDEQYRLPTSIHIEKEEDGVYDETIKYRNQKYITCDDFHYFTIIDKQLIQFIRYNEKDVVYVKYHNNEIVSIENIFDWDQTILYKIKNNKIIYCTYCWKSHICWTGFNENGEIIECKTHNENPLWTEAPILDNLCHEFDILDHEWVLEYLPKYYL